MSETHQSETRIAALTHFINGGRVEIVSNRFSYSLNLATGAEFTMPVAK
ncbi:hypothetical protein [Caballeronia sordidicola]|jgi:malonate-semialdehyde dehydrogenase (acetylating)/methylmalonate-semialdehyde dehydrogenase|uniref:Uncharacterized protein n=1 Tax=Caballeronia sordidicola TaxID=196367 RepID=A0A226XAG7_CABSO|nr:hypothetical protein [Caballeronia sordidicola]OXC80492.1 hypothetical protein BSU04_01750 [Caballeronia sordidicola]